ncbi:receptor-like kinase [Trifolium medium]|uniref:Receptor-like kinase n=1 Tax=Trifolium medium TaxID=97028 RepID=A0A392PG82_9FABA|nr:receptor-like kinase [Trifolium medium]
MIVQEDGIKKINWRWRRRLFQWEKEMVEVCSGLALGVRRAESEGDCWKWREESFTVKEAYQLLIEGEEEDEECDWARDVWNQLVPSNMSTLVWRLFHKRLPTKENLMNRGISINSAVLCAGGCGSPETENHLFFNCPTFGSI